MWTTAIACISIIVSVSSIYLSYKANKLADKANELSKENAEFSKDLNKVKITKSIIDEISNDWNSSRHIILTHWKFYQSRDFTKEDFNEIWEIANYRKKGKAARLSFEQILNEQS
ncbi:hypothetical protein J2N86_16055 (plasmid) [Legionella lytica]|uniref:Uncharacterized protein n=1 Tax=Legionella lytica TaxID=96232 RepID=A0ABY4YD24_9GAMM|nr:hypothetical protein [Legionella lytica]USQ15538.1 hypothetical protein J2N86_16055 [Legionella lytica]